MDTSVDVIIIILHQSYCYSYSMLEYRLIVLKLLWYIIIMIVELLQVQCSTVMGSVIGGP